jgi:YVTN family beta-propeller protein
MLKKLVLLAFSALGLVALLAIVPGAHADGGAPNLAYIAGSNKGVSIIDVAQQKVTGTINVGGDPHAVALSLDARFLYVTQPSTNQFSIIAARTSEKICTANVPGTPSVLVVDNNTNLVYVGGNQSPNVSVIDGTNCAIKRTLATDGPVYGLGIATVGSTLPNSSGSQIWVSASKTVQIFDGNSGKQIGKIALANPGYIAIPPGTTSYVTLRTGGMVAIDLGTQKIVPLLSTGTFGPMDYDATTGEIYVPDLGNKQLLILTPVNTGVALPREPNRSISLNDKPAAIAITSDGQLGFVALQGGDVLMLDIPGRQSITTLHVGGTPHAIITGLYPPTIGTTPQQASNATNIANIIGYVLIVLIFIVPFILFRRFSKSQKNNARTNSAPTEEATQESATER